MARQGDEHALPYVASAGRLTWTTANPTMGAMLKPQDAIDPRNDGVAALKSSRPEPEQPPQEATNACSQRGEP